MKLDPWAARDWVFSPTFQRGGVFGRQTKDLMWGFFIWGLLYLESYDVFDILWVVQGEASLCRSQTAATLQLLTWPFLVVRSSSLTHPSSQCNKWEKISGSQNHRYSASFSKSLVACNGVTKESPSPTKCCSTEDTLGPHTAAFQCLITLHSNKFGHLAPEIYNLWPCSGHQWCLSSRVGCPALGPFCSCRQNGLPLSVVIFYIKCKDFRHKEIIFSKKVIYVFSDFN